MRKSKISIFLISLKLLSKIKPKEIRIIRISNRSNKFKIMDKKNKKIFKDKMLFHKKIFKSLMKIMMKILFLVLLQKRKVESHLQRNFILLSKRIKNTTQLLSILKK